MPVAVPDVLYLDAVPINSEFCCKSMAVIAAAQGSLFGAWLSDP